MGDDGVVGWDLPRVPLEVPGLEEVVGWPPAGCVHTTYSASYALSLYHTIRTYLYYILQGLAAVTPANPYVL